MKEKRRCLWQLTLLMVAFLSGLMLWHVLSILLSYSEVPDFSPVYITHSELYNFSYPLHLLAPNDYGLLVNYSFTFNILNLGCDEDTFLLVLVHSSPSNFKKRAVIRSTWGNKTEDVKLYFVMGKPVAPSTQEKIENENKNHQDIIQGNFLDVYRNLTYKHIVTLKYATYHCSQAKYILKTDDDVFVNMPLMKHFLSVDLSPFGTSELLFCTLKKSATVLRTYRSKWRVGFEEYPFRTYPPYCPGWAILYSPDILFRLYKAAQNTLEVFWIDDVHVTGILAAKTNITHTDSTSLIISKRAQFNLVKNYVFPKKPFLFGQPDLKETDIKNMWLGVITHGVSKFSLAGR